jgi:hypothetical protein
MREAYSGYSWRWIERAPRKRQNYCRSLGTLFFASVEEGRWQNCEKLLCLLGVKGSSLKY